MARTSVKSCRCLNPYQDKKYGQYKRVHNRTHVGWRCTSCGKDKRED